MDDGLRQVELRLGQADVLERVGGGHRHDERLRVGLADVLAGQDDHAADDEAGVLTGLEHAGEPVEAGVGIGAADALDERGDHVVVLVAPVAQRLGAERGLGVGERDLRAAWRGPRAMATATSRLVSTWRPSPLAWPARCSTRVGLGGGALGLEAALEQRAGGVLVERVEAEERRPAEQRRVHLEERVLGGGADQRDEAALDAGEERVLLRLVEAVHLVEEEDRALAALAEAVPGALERVAHVLHAGAHGAELLEGLARVGGDRLGQRRLPGARRPPEDHRRQPVGLHQRPQRLPRSEQVLLPDDVVQAPRPQPSRQRRDGRQRVLRRRGEQIVRHQRLTLAKCTLMHLQ